MAKKSITAFDDFDDFEDFSHFDEGLGEGSYKSTTKKGKAREAVGLLTGGFVTGVKKSLLTRGFYQTTVSKALPHEYTVALDKSLEVKDTIEDLYDTAVTESTQINDKLTKGVKPIVDKYGDKLPQRMARPLRKWTQNVRSTNEWTQENKDELESVAALNDIFNKRAQTHSAKNTSVQAQVQTGIAKNNLSLTAQLVQIQQSQLAYQDQIDSNWKRKSLELQYKQFFVQRKLLDVQQQSLSFNKTILPEIMKNSALPDLVKAKGTEVGSRMVTEKLYGAAINQFSGLPYGIIRNLSNNVTKKMRGASSNVQQDLQSGLSELHDMLEQSSEMRELQGARQSTRDSGELAGGIATRGIGYLLGKKFNKKFGDNERVMKGADMLSSGMRRAPRMFNDMVQNGDSGNPLIDMLLELSDAKQVMNVGRGSVMKNQENDLDKQMYFDLLTKKSITEIIPGYLTRIHHEIKSLRTGDTSHPMIDFDFKKGVFSDSVTLGKRMRDTAIGSRQKQALGGIHDELSDALGLNGDKDNNNQGALSEDLKYELLKQFSLASINNSDFTMGSMFDDDKSKLDDTQKDELRQFLLEKYGITINDDDDYNVGFIDKVKKGLAEQQGMGSGAAKAQRNINDAMDRLQSYVVNPTGLMNKAAQRGQLKYGNDLGILDESGGNYTLNYEKFIEALMDRTGNDDPDSSGDFKPDGPKPDSATKKYGKHLWERTKALTESDRAATIRSLSGATLETATQGAAQARSSFNNTRDSLDLSGLGANINSLTQDRLEQVRIAEFKNKFKRVNWENIKSKYEKSDKLSRAYEIIEEMFGKGTISITNIKVAYEKNKEFREIMREIDALELEDSGNRSTNTSSMSSNIKDKANEAIDKISRTYSKVSSKGEVEADISDFEDAEDYADNFINQNAINDTDGNIKESLIKDFFKTRFGNTGTYINFKKANKSFGGAINRGKKGMRNLSTKGGTGATGEAMSILFELSKWSAKAADIATKPSRAALKLIPFGLKKLVSLVVDTVNFKHIQHGLWLEGEKEPRLLKTGLLSGRYLNEEGDVVEKPKDLVGNIFDAMTTPQSLIMSASEYKGGLFDSTGKLIYKPPTVIGRIASGIVKLPFKIMKGTTKLAGRFAMGYLKVTTKPVTWLINKILQEKRIDPKLHAELAHLGLTDQTNRKLDGLTELIDERFPDKKDPKFNDKDGDGDRDGNAEDVREARESKRNTEKEKKKGFLAKLRDRKKKPKDDDEDEEEGGGIFGMLGKGKMLGRLAGLAKNPYVLGGMAIASLIGWEGLTDDGKNKDPEDVANMLLPDTMKDNKMARIGVRLSEKLVNGLLLPVKGQLKGVVKTIEYASRLSKWVNRKDGKLKDATKTFLSSIPGATAKFLFGRSAGKAVDRLLNVDNINPLFRFRMAQYGFKHTDTEGVQAILKLEDDILKDLVVATETAPAKIADSVTIEQCASYFGVSINDEADLTEWITWFANRFRPVFISNVTVMQRMKYDSRKLHDVDSLMGKKDKADFIKKVDFNRGNFNPYDKPANPMGTEWTLDIVSQSALDVIKDDSLADIDDMPDDPVAIKKEQARTTKRGDKLKSNALNKHKDTVAEKRFDPYAKIDSINFKSMLGLKAKDKSINDVIGEESSGFGGSGAGASFATAQRAANIDKHGAVGEMLSGIGGLFMKKANASNFIPGVTPLDGAKGVSSTTATGNFVAKKTGTYKPNAIDGASSLGVADKPIAAVRSLRETALDTGNGRASKHIKTALIAAGYKFTAPSSAADYPAQALPEMGFEKIANDTPWVTGDIMVFSSNKYHKNGHIQIFDGANWISDYVQEFWVPMSDNVPTYTLWRDTEFTNKGKFAKRAGNQKDGVGNIVKKEKPVTVDSAMPELEPKTSSSLIKSALAKLDKIGQSASDTMGGIMDKIKNSNLGQTASSLYNGAKDRVSNAIAQMSGSQKEWQMKVYLAFKNAGFSEMQSRIMTAEIGREGSYNPKYMFAGHADPHSGSNLGMLSWQGSRKPKLIAFLKNAGVLDGSNNMIPGQEALDAQARFIMWEMKNTHKGVGLEFLSRPNLAYAEGAYMIGKRYILWRIDDPKYGPDGKKNRDAFYNMLTKQLSGGNILNKANATLTKFAAPIVNPLNNAAAKLKSLITGVSTDKATADKDGVASSTDTSGGGSTKISGNAKPAIAAKYCRNNAASGSKGLCATYVRKGFQAAKYQFQQQASAYQYHTNGTMLTMGFVQISGQSARQVGDVIILNRNLSAGKPHGHIAIWDGANWVSDFVQRTWTPYRAKVFPWSIWRDRNFLNGASMASGWAPGNTSPNSTTSNAVLNAADGTYGDGASAKVPYSVVTMKYNDYSGIDDKLKKSYKDGSTVALNDNTKDAPASTVDKAAAGNSTKVGVAQKKVATATTAAAKAAETAKSKNAEMTKALVKATSLTSSFTANANVVENDRTKKVEEQVTKNLAQQMSAAEAKRNSDDLSASTQMLRESLKVQRGMLDKLTSIDKHLQGVLKGQAKRVVTESSNTQAANDPSVRPNKQQDHQVKRAGRDEPMSMSKMI